MWRSLEKIGLNIAHFWHPGIISGVVTLNLLLYWFSALTGTWSIELLGRRRLSDVLWKIVSGLLECISSTIKATSTRIRVHKLDMLRLQSLLAPNMLFLFLVSLSYQLLSKTEKLLLSWILNISHTTWLSTKQAQLLLECLLLLLHLMLQSLYFSMKILLKFSWNFIDNSCLVYRLCWLGMEISIFSKHWTFKVRRRLKVVLLYLRQRDFWFYGKTGFFCVFLKCRSQFFFQFLLFCQF